MGKKGESAKIEWVVNENGCHICTSHCLWSKKLGYYSCTIDGIKYKMHRYVYSKYYLNGDNIPKGLVVRHKCDNSLCINPEHLQLGTQGDNVRDMISRKRFKPRNGENNVRAKLTDEKVIEIFYADGSIDDITKRFEVSKSQVMKIRNKTGWGHIVDKLEIPFGRGQLRPCDVVDIFLSKEKPKAMQNKYGINRGQVWKIRTRRAWAEITKDL